MQQRSTTSHPLQHAPSTLTKSSLSLVGANPLHLCRYIRTIRLDVTAMQRLVVSDRMISTRTIGWTDWNCTWRLTTFTWPLGIPFKQTVVCPKAIDTRPCKDSSSTLPVRLAGLYIDLPATNCGTIRGHTCTNYKIYVNVNKKYPL